MNPYKLGIRKNIAEIEEANNNPCGSLTETAKATLVLGSTGGGKTTLLEFLLNKELTLAIKYGNPYLDSKTNQIGHGGQAKTDQVMIYTYDDNQVFIDTPGFGDTRGEYTEIKNHIAIRNVVECSKIAGVRMIFVVPKSVIFYEANRGTDLIKFVNSVRSFIPDFSAKKWIDQTFIVVTKTETRTTTNHAIEAIGDGIKEIKEGTILTTEERAFFEYLMKNQRVKLFPMPEEPYKVGETFQNNELRNDILNFIKQTPTVKISKNDFKKDFQLNLAGDILDDFNKGKTSFDAEYKKNIDNVAERIKDYVKLFPQKGFSVKEYKQVKKVLDDCASNIKKICEETSPAKPIREGSIKLGDFNELKESISLFCELDYSAQFLKKYTSSRENLFAMETEGEKLSKIINKINTYYEWMICTSNIYKTFFNFLMLKDNKKEASGIDEILRGNKDAYKFFGHTDESSIRNLILDGCAKTENTDKSKNIRRELEDLRENNLESNTLDKLVKLALSISIEENPQYGKCTIKGFMPTVLQLVVDSAALSDCAEIAIYGVYGIKIAGPLELPGKNLVMIAPYFKVMDNQKIKLDGVSGTKSSKLKDNTGEDGAAGNIGGNGGSLYGHCMDIFGGKLTLSSKGGDGADGQNGSSGKNGKKGDPATLDHIKDSKLRVDSASSEPVKNKVDHKNWDWYKKISCADTAQEGEKGGKGGTGGEGGKGGLPGEIDFKIKGAETDKTKYFSSITTTGKKGQNGEPGIGGEGGEHGDALCYLVEYVSTYNPYFHLKGNIPSDNYAQKLGLPTSNGPDSFQNIQYPSLNKHEKAPNGDLGSTDPINKSKTPPKLKSINKDKHIAEYVDFISKVQNIHDMVAREDTTGKSLSYDNEEILQFFQNLLNPDPLPMECE